MPKKRSEAGAVIAYFSFRPLEEVEITWGIVAELMRDRRRGNRPKPVRTKNLLWKHRDDVVCEGGDCTKESCPSHWKPQTAKQIVKAASAITTD